MLRNLKNALDSKNISVKAFSCVLGVSEKTAWNKLNGETDISWPEARKTKMELLPEYDFEYLFATDEEMAQGGQE